MADGTQVRILSNQLIGRLVVRTRIKKNSDKFTYSKLKRNFDHNEEVAGSNPALPTYGEVAQR